MATTVARLQAILSADTRAFDRAMDKSHKNLTGVSKGAGIAAAALGGALFLGARAGFKELMQGEKVAAQTEAALRSTGGAAHVTAKDIDRLAKSLMKKSGVDDEAIKSSENLLLTFRGIRNETGKGNKIFNQATKAVLDLSVAFHKDLNSSAILVGKALQDPVKGMSALRRVGVQLDSSQQTLIKDLIEGRKAVDTIAIGFDNLSPKQSEQVVKLGKLGLGWQEIADQLNLKYTPAQQKAFDFMEAGGHTIQAQKIILGELKKETEGSAEAYGKTLPGQIAILRESFKNLAADIVAAVIPTFKQVTGVVLKVVEKLQEHKTVTDVLVKSIVTLTVVLAAAAAAHKIQAAALTLATTATKLYELWVLRAEVATAALNVTSRASPWIAAATAIATVVAVLIILENKYQAVSNAIKYLRGHELALLAVPIVGQFTLAIIAVNKLSGSFGKLVGWLKDAVGYVKDLVGWLKKIPSIHIGLPKIPNLNPFGDGSGPKLPPGATTGTSAEGKAFNVGTQLWDEIRMGNMLGLHVTSGYRAGAKTKHGTPSDHGANPSRAVDMSGPPSAMAGLFKALIGRKEIRQAFYDPLGSIFGGVRSSYREGGHSDHIHIAEYDKGGYLRPGWNLAYNGLGRPEQVGGSVTIPVSIGGEHIATVVFDMLRRKAKVFENRNGRPAFGGL